MKFATFLRTPFFIEHLQWMLLYEAFHKLLFSMIHQGCLTAVQKCCFSKQRYSTFILAVPYISHLSQKMTQSKKSWEPVMKLEILISVTKNEIKNSRKFSAKIKGKCLCRNRFFDKFKRCMPVEDPCRPICGHLSILTQFFLTTDSFSPFLLG